MESTGRPYREVGNNFIKKNNPGVVQRGKEKS